jgi:cytoskeletal protein CcmA (bactofilin family)
LFEVKRKPNESRSTRSASAAPANTYPKQLDLQHDSAVASTCVAPLVNRNQTLPTLVPAPLETRNSQTRMPVITGEARYRGVLPIDGVLVGQLGGNGGSLAIRQKCAPTFGSEPELSGEISFREMLRVNGRVAGTVYSKNGTLIVDTSARVDAKIEVGTAIVYGTVYGDIVAQQRVEVGATAKIYGNIWTRSLAIKDGAIFDGVCNMISQSQENKASPAA